MIPSLVLLQEVERAARDALHETPVAGRAEPLLRGWVEVIECAAGALAAIPASAEMSGHRQPGHPMESIRGIAREIYRSLLDVADPGDIDHRMRRAADLLADLGARAPAELPRDRSQSSEADAAVMRSGILHTCLLLTHATAISLGTTDPEAPNPRVGERVDSSSSLRHRISSAEQILTAHLSHQLPPLAEVSRHSPASKLADALSRWERAAHDTIRHYPDAKNHAVIADVNLGLLAKSGRVSLTSAEAGRLSPSQVSQRLVPAIVRATHAWEVTRADWTSLASPQTGLSRPLLEAAYDLRNAIKDPALVGDPGAPGVLMRGLAGGQEAAILLRQAMNEPGLRVPAETVVRLTAGLAARHPEQVSFETWAGLERLHGRAPIPLPDVLRHHLMDRATATVEAAAVARSASHVMQSLNVNVTGDRFHAARATRAVCPRRVALHPPPRVPSAREVRTR